MPRTRIKICGVTRPEDAALAVDAGADAVGIVFYEKAKRCVPLSRAREIVAALPAFVTPVALFVDDTADRIRDVTAQLGIHHVQLHGHESPDLVRQLRSHTVIKAIRADRATLASDIAGWKRAIRELHLTHLKGFVVETPNTTAPGGTGVENDWDAVLQLQRSGAWDPADTPSLIAAGGLRPENVAAVIRTLRPHTVDVSSGVEGETFGQKSAERVTAFVEAVRSADAQAV